VIRRARVRIWTADRIELASFTCPAESARRMVLRDLREEEPGTFATITPQDGGPTERVEKPRR